jgi:hypothetical protein
MQELMVLVQAETPKIEHLTSKRIGSLQSTMINTQFFAIISTPTCNHCIFNTITLQIIYGIQMELTFKLAYMQKQGFLLGEDQMQFIALSPSLGNGEL